MISLFNGFSLPICLNNIVCMSEIKLSVDSHSSKELCLLRIKRH